MTPVTILETNLLHASDVLFWLDGSSADDPLHMLRVPVPVALELTDRPRDLQLVHSQGRTALLRRPSTPMHDGATTEAQRQRPPQPPFALAGRVSDAGGRYLPRQFSLNADGSGHALVLYPSPLGCVFGPAGGLQGNLRFSLSAAPACWALLTLTVTTALGVSLNFRGQTNAAGDFRLPLHRLPPLPEGIDHYTAQLSVRALASARADTPLDPATLVAMPLGDLAANTFSNPIGLNVVPGEIRTLRSLNRDHLAVQSS